MSFLDQMYIDVYGVNVRFLQKKSVLVSGLSDESSIYVFIFAVKHYNHNVFFLGEWGACCTSSQSS